MGRSLRRSSALVALCLTLVCAGAGAGICAAVSATHPMALVLVVAFLAVFVLANRALSALLAARRSDHSPETTRATPSKPDGQSGRPKPGRSHSQRPRSSP